MNIKADVARLPLKIKVKLCSGQSFWRTKTFAKYGIKIGRASCRERV